VNILAKTIPAGGKTATLAARDFTGTWEEWTSARKTGTSRAYAYSLTLTKFTPPLLSIPRHDFQYDNLAMTADAVAQYLDQVKNYRDAILHTSLVSNSGAGPLGIDGVNLFSTAHPNGPSGNQSNKGTTALSPASFATGYVAMTSLQRESGEPFRVKPRYLIVGQKLRQMALEIAASDIRGASYAADGLEAGTRLASAGISNVNNGIVEVIIDDRLTGTYDDYWYIVGEGGVKPFAFLEGMAPTSQICTDMNNPDVIASDAFTFGLLADAQIGGYGWPNIYAGIVA
jgi:phage major head subunit gpT-like protein